MIRIAIGLVTVYLCVCLLIYFLQNKLLFHPVKLPEDYAFSFDLPFKEVNYQVAEGVTINALKFSASEPKGVAYYLHGNAGSLVNWGNAAEIFVKNGYDVLMIDYRGYGKSTGILSKENMVSDVQYIYDQLKEDYPEESTVVYGRSLGSGIAAHLAAGNNPGLLILETPYYSLRDVAKRMFPFVPPFLLRFNFNTYEALPKISCPIYLFHGTNDEVVYFGSSMKLQPLLKEKDQLIIIEGGGHNNLNSFPDYESEMNKILQN